MEPVPSQASMQACLDLIEAERRNLAHELHDEIGQSLTAIRTSAQLIARQSEGRQTYPVAKGIVELTDHMFDLLHQMLHRLHPTVLNELGLLAALADLADFSRKHLSLQCSIQTEGDLDRLPLPVRLAVYRIVQEALNNASRHGMATHASIHISRESKLLHISVENNGKPLRESALKSPGIGISGMQQRVAAFHGRLHIQNTASHGVGVYADLPLDGIAT